MLQSIIVKEFLETAKEESDKAVVDRLYRIIIYKKKSELNKKYKKYIEVLLSL